MPKDLRATELVRTADALAEHVFRRTSSWSTGDRQTMGSQLCRAALSVPCNLAESTSRKSAKERHRFVEIADGSLREAGYVLDLAARLGAFDAATATLLRELFERATVLLSSHRARARRSADARPRKKRRGRRAPRPTTVAPRIATPREDDPRQSALDLAQPGG